MKTSMIQFTASARAQSAIAKACEKDPLKMAFVNAVDDKPAEILVYGEIGNPYEASDAGSVGQFLRANKGRPVHVRINSPGGLAFDGVTIHNALRAHDGAVTTTIEGLAASAASIIALAGKSRMYENAQFMMHRAMGGAFGNRSVMLEVADILDKIDDGLALTYQAKSGKPKAQILKMMEGEVDGTWLSAKEAKAMGFIDEIVRLNGATNSVAKVSEAMLAAHRREERKARLGIL